MTSEDLEKAKEILDKARITSWPRHIYYDGGWYTLHNNSEVEEWCHEQAEKICKTTSNDTSIQDEGRSGQDKIHETST
jgi:hypothetical protein